MTQRKTIVDIRSQKAGVPLVVLTAYTAPFARILDPHVDVLLVGDSVGMVLYGMDSTLGVSLDMMIQHGRAVVKSSTQACVVVDMPFGSYQASKEQAFVSAARILSETGCQAVKLEGGMEMAETVRFLVERAVPVMAHIGLMPQHVHRMGGYKYQGRTDADRKQLIESALALQQAGAFAMVLEGVEESLAREITAQLAIPTIGIGASVACDGQVLVTEDMAGFFAKTPKFVKQFAALGTELDCAVAKYAAAVRSRAFPTDEQCYK